MTEHGQKNMQGEQVTPSSPLVGAFRNLSRNIVGAAVGGLTGYLAARGFELTPDTQASLVLIGMAVFSALAEFLAKRARQSAGPDGFLGLGKIFVLPLLFLITGCFTVQAPVRASVQLSEESEPPVLVVRSFGKGCVYAELEPSKLTVIAESDGASVNLAALFRSAVDIVGNVFGAARSEESDKLEQGEGCRGVVDQLFESNENEVRETSPGVFSSGASDG